MHRSSVAIYAHSPNMHVGAAATGNGRRPTGGRVVCVFNWYDVTAGKVTSWMEVWRWRMLCGAVERHERSPWLGIEPVSLPGGGRPENKGKWIPVIHWRRKNAVSRFKTNSGISNQGAVTHSCIVIDFRAAMGKMIQSTDNCDLLIRKCMFIHILQFNVLHEMAEDTINLNLHPCCHSRNNRCQIICPRTCGHTHSGFLVAGTPPKQNVAAVS